MNSNNAMKFGEWIKSKISWFVTLIIATSLSLTVVNMKDIVLKFEILFAIIISASFVFLVTYIIDFNKDYKRIMQSERVPMDAILETEAKKVIFDDVTFTEKTAEVKVLRKLYNNMLTSDEIYDRYKIIIKSHTDVPNLDDITLIMANKIMELSELDQDITQPMRYLEIDSDEVNNGELNISEPRRKTVEFFVPLHLKAGKTCNFELSYRTNAYKNALCGTEDSIQMPVNRITNQLSIEVILKGQMKKRFKVSPCVEEDGSRLSHKIFDASLERMKRTESQLETKPEYKNDNAIWEVRNPKIGYTYRLYFRILPKPLNSNLLHH